MFLCFLCRCYYFFYIFSRFNAFIKSVGTSVILFSHTSYFLPPQSTFLTFQLLYHFRPYISHELKFYTLLKYQFLMLFLCQKQKYFLPLLFPCHFVNKQVVLLNILLFFLICCLS